MAELGGALREWLNQIKDCEGYCDCVGHDDLLILQIEDAAPQVDIAHQLLQDALFLRSMGERPPGAPPDNPEAETWRDWEIRAERFLRSLIPGTSDVQ